MAPATNLELKKLTPILFKQLIAWGPIVVGLVHQFFMLLFNVQCIYVFVDPPGYIRPLVTLEYQWWFVLLLGSALVCVLAYVERLRSIPRRAALPFYLYILFLLIFVKPVAHRGGELPARCGAQAAESAPASSVIIWASPDYS